MIGVIKQYIIGNKPFLSGLAIILVILYHTELMCFYLGFLGVDIFMFLSGYFLCYSYENKSLVNFYKRRYTRILPIYIILALFICIKDDTCITVWDWICNLTTLSYYQLGGSFVDWYLSALFYFYLMFPIFYKFSKYKRVEYVLLILVFVLFVIVDLHWKYECALGRIPIFFMGILSYHEGKDSCNKTIKFACFSFLLSLIAIVIYVGSSNLQTFYLFYLMAPIMFYVTCYLLSRVKFNLYLKRSIEYLGNNSLEIYVGNVIAMNLNRHIILFEGISHAVNLIILTMIFSILCIFYNRFILNNVKIKC